MQYAFTRAIPGHFLKNCDGVLKVEDRSDLIQGRAKEYAGALQRFEAQRARQAKSNEALAKEQIKYLMSIGVKINDLKREQSKEAKALEAYLAEVRPPFLSRPG